MGMQLDIPFQYGSFFLTTTFVYGNGLQIIGGLIFSIIVTICITIMTGMMVWKLKNLKLISSQNSAKKAKAEATLTITMIIILIPATLTQVLSISSLLESKYAGYIILIRPVFMDCRVNIVSCYFYWTHPYFRNNSVAPSIFVRSISNC
ncbi:unnamed protein product [Caenorhabditis brenneri]